MVKPIGRSMNSCAVSVNPARTRGNTSERTLGKSMLGACLRNGNGDYRENGCTGGTKKRRTNGEDQRLTRPIEDELSSPFNLRYSVSPVSPCPPHPPFSRLRLPRLPAPAQSVPRRRYSSRDSGGTATGARCCGI